jgi:hypothetical protein
MPIQGLDVVQLSVIGTVTGQDHVHTLHFQKIGTTDIAALVASWQTNCLTAYRAMFLTTDTPVRIVRGSHACGTIPLDATVDVIPLVASQAGSRTPSGHPLPSFVATCVSEKGALSGQRRSGRFFIGGMQEDDTNGNLIEGTQVTRVTAYCTTLMTNYVTPLTPDWRLVTYSKTTRDEGSSCAASAFPVASLIVRTSPATVRRRKMGRGN